MRSQIESTLHTILNVCIAAWLGPPQCLVHKPVWSSSVLLGCSVGVSKSGLRDMQVGEVYVHLYLVHFDARQNSLSGQAVHKWDVLRGVLIQSFLKEYGPGYAAANARGIELLPVCLPNVLHSKHAMTYLMTFTCWPLVGISAAEVLPVRFPKI